MIEISLKDIEGTAEFFRRLPKLADQAARLAVNRAIRFGAAEGSRRIREQLAFTRTQMGNVNDNSSRLHISRYATPADHTAVITARQRPTSLQTFAQGPVTFGRRTSGVRVRVKPGSSKMIGKGFFFKLKSGNVGVGLRLKEGQRIENKRVFQKAIKSTLRNDGSQVYLLYGPSVDQAFQTVREDITPKVTEVLGAEFNRQMARLTRA